MSNPPRRSRPKKPATTIDLEATTIPAVGYPGPMSADAPPSPAGSGTARETVLDPETTTADAASETQASTTGETTDGARATTEAFAEEESLSGPHSGEGRTSDLDETILSAAVPDFVADDTDRPSGPPAPTYDYNHPPQAVAADSKGGFGSAFGGALLGAVLALAGAGALQYAGYLPAIGIVETPDTAPQFARAGDVQQVSTDLGALRAEVEQLRSAQAAGGTGAGASSADLTAVTDRVTALEQRGGPRSASGAVTDKAASAAQTTADNAAKAADAARQAAEQASQAAGTAGQTATGAQATAGDARQAAETARQTAETAQRTAETARETADIAKQAADTAQQAAATAQQAAAGAQTGATTANTAIAAFDTRLGAIEAGNRQAGIAVAAAALKAGIDRGGPFMSELESFATVAGTSPAVETLRGFAAEGVPSPQALSAEWPEVEQAIAAALRPVDPNASVGDQILTGLGALVTTRSVGAPAPATAEGPAAALSRLSAAISGGQFEAWLTEWQALPQPAQDASRAFKAKVEARARTEAVLGETLSNAVKAVAQPAGTAG